MVPIASDRLSFCEGTEGTDAFSGPEGAVTLWCVRRHSGQVSVSKRIEMKRETTDCGELEC